MTNLLIIQFLFLSFCLIGVYLAYWPLSSDESLNHFGIWPDGKARSKKYKKDARLDAAVSESARAIVLIILSTFMVVLFLGTRSPIPNIYENQLFRLLLISLVIASFIWSLYLGPRKLAQLDDIPLTYRQHIKPYIGFLLYILGLWCGTASLTINAILEGVFFDFQLLENTTREFSTLLNSGLTTLINLQKTSINIASLGNQIALTSQKYAAFVLLAFIYLIAEQRTNMRKTLLITSVDRLKYGIWVISLVALIFGVIYLPLRYQGLHVTLQKSLLQSASIETDVEVMNSLIDIQAYVEDHDLKWLLLEIVTGYGNFITFVLVGGFLLLRRLLFKGIPIAAILELLLPTPTFQIIFKFSDRLGIDLDSAKTEARPDVS